MENSKHSGRKRHRVGTDSKECRDYATFISDKKMDEGEPFKTATIRTRTPRSFDYVGFRFRISERWGDLPRERKFYPLPYISVSGKFSLQPLYRWLCSPSQWFSSVSSTIYTRLLSLLTRRFGFQRKYMRRYRQIILKVSLIYALTHDDSVIDRFLGILGSPKNHGTATRYIHFCYCRLDDTSRFVFNQACSQASWFKLLAERPSDKSSKNLSSRHRRKVESLRPSNIDICLCARNFTEIYWTNRIRSGSRNLLPTLASSESSGELECYSFGSELPSSDEDF